MSVHPCPVCGRPPQDWPMAFRGDPCCSVLCAKQAGLQPVESAGATAVPDLPVRQVASEHPTGLESGPTPNGRVTPTPTPTQPEPPACPGCHKVVEREGETGIATVLYRGRAWHRNCAEEDGGHD